MLNQVVLVGRINNIDKKQNTITLSVMSSTKNSDGEYPTNYFDITLSENIFNNVTDYCTINDMVGVKGHIERLDIKEKVNIIADRISFLSSKAKSEEC